MNKLTDLPNSDGFFGEYGGKFVPETLMHALKELDETYLTLKSNSKFIEIDYITEGPACSALLFKNEINNDDELIIANCDQIMEWNSNNFLHNIKLYDGAMVYG